MSWQWLKSRFEQWTPPNARTSWLICAAVAVGLVIFDAWRGGPGALLIAFHGFLLGFALQGVYVTKLLREMRETNEVYRANIESMCDSLNADIRQRVAEIESRKPPEERRLH